LFNVRVLPSDILEKYSSKTNTFLTVVAETAMGTPVHAQESADSKYVTALYE
jgi:hypothetical protein